jgi:hypothetical protein
LLASTASGCGYLFFDVTDGGGAIDTGLDGGLDAGLDAGLDGGALDAPAMDEAAVDDAGVSLPLVCPAGAIVCDSFDGPGDAGWRVIGGGTDSREVVGAFSPPASLRARAPAGSSRRLFLDLPPTVIAAGLWTRVMVRVPPSPSAGYLVAFELGSVSPMFKVSLDFYTSGGAIFSPGEIFPVALTEGRWACVEIYLRDAPDPATDQLIVWMTRDGITDGIDTEATVRFEDFGAASPFSLLIVGPLADLTDADLMLDDAYAGPLRAGCPDI